MLKKKRGGVLLITLLALAHPSAAGPQPTIYVSIPPQAWLTRQLVSDQAAVRTILRPGSDPHTFDPTAREIKLLADASLYLTLGIPFEQALTDKAATLNPLLKVAPMDKGIVKLGAHIHHHHTHSSCCGHGGDPHIWLSPRLMRSMASNTVEALCATFDQQPEHYHSRLTRTLEIIAEIDSEIRSSLQNLPVRAWVTYHPSWSYFADDYALDLLVIEQDGKKPAARHLAKVIAAARAANVRTVFAEPQYDQRMATTLARHLDANMVVIDPLLEDWPAIMRSAATALGGKKNISHSNREVHP